MEILVFGPHPDDAELGCGGAIAKATQAGLQVGIIDLTAGEKGTRGTAETRLAEAQKAAKLLGVSSRENLKLPDANLEFSITKETVLLLANKIREHRPRIVLIPFWVDRHPDHIATSQLATKACHYAKLQKIVLEHPKYKVPQIIYYELNGECQQSFIMDISETFELKKKAIMSHSSQFEAFTKEYLPFPVEERCRYYGALIGRTFGEAFKMKNPVRINDWKTLQI